MAAEVEKRMVPRYTAMCADCDDLYIGASSRAPEVQRKADQHNKYAHDYPALSHQIAHVHQNLFNYTVECVCFDRQQWETTNFNGWRCPRDRTRQ